ncbi:MAG: sugar ABC transporter ATP-binding protein [Anaerolineaceae bacterium]|nr:sugar ABC transporter ATP-binding protein [Anaerolineaceae bacterium]
MTEILSLKNITKLYPGVKALDNVSVSIQAGEVHAIMGENGAGKSTLMKVLNGIISANSGEIWFEGKKVNIRSPHDARSLGISMIMQELNPIKDLTVAENMFVGRYPTRHGLVDWKTTYEQCSRLFEHWKVDYDPHQKVRTMSTAEIQMLEILKAISYDAKLIIMDEPTSAITEKEVQKLFSFIEELKNKGITIIIITHKIDEVFVVADRVSVLRDGQYIGTSDIQTLDRNHLISMMVGREITNVYPHREKIESEPVLSVKNLNRGRKVQNISFDLKKGEILGFAGIVGAGRTETMRCIFGLDRKQSGSVVLDDKNIEINSPRDAIQNGIVMVTESRKEDGLILCRSILENTILPSTFINSNHGFLDKRKEYGLANEMCQRLRVKTPSYNKIVNQLSGGNQQKVIITKWLLMNPKVLILDEPTRGIDVGAKSEIYQIMNDLTEQGVSIIMVSSDMEEMIGMSDRILVMCEGQISGELQKEEFTQEKILEYAAEVQK